VSLDRKERSRDERSGRASPESNVAARACDHGTGRNARSRSGGQRAATEDCRESLATHSADAETAGRAQETAIAVRRRRAVRREGDLRSRKRWRRLGVAKARAV